MRDVYCNMNYKEVMRGEMKPDVYDGPECDGIKPYWYMYVEGGTEHCKLLRTNDDGKCDAYLNPTFGEDSANDPFRWVKR